MNFLKKYENKANVTGELIKKARTRQKLSKSAVCRKLQLHAVYIDRVQLYKMESGQRIIKDFELLALRKVLGIDIETLDNTIM